MSLYDGIPMDDGSPSSILSMPPSQSPRQLKISPGIIAKSSDATTTLTTYPSSLQSQIKLETPKIASYTSRVIPTTPASRSRSESLLKPRKALVLDDGPPLSFIPKAIKEDKVWLFGEIMVEDEYNPLLPNDYERSRKARDEEKQKQRLEDRKKDLDDLKRKQNKHVDEQREEILEVQKRSTGVAIAPPATLLQADSVQLEPTSIPKTPSFKPSFGSGGKGLGIAARIMTKMGYKEGSGLGRQGQGISTALKVEKTGRVGGVIIHEHDEAKGHQGE